MKKTNTIRYLTSVLLLFLLTGCWSSHEIEELGLTFAMGIDKGEETELEKKFDKVGGDYPKKDRITMIYQYVNEQAAGSKSIGVSTDQKTYINVYETGDSLQQINAEVALRQDRPVFSPHLKVIVIAADLLRTYSLSELLDQPLRDNEIRPSSMVLVTRGRARDTLELKETGEMPAFRLLKIVENEYKAKKILPPVTLAKLTGKMRSGTSYLLQNVIGTDGEIKYAGAAAINGKTNKLIGYLDEHDLEGVMWIIGKGIGGMVKSYDPTEKKVTAFGVESIKSNIKPIVKGNRLSFEVNVKSEGYLAENWNTKEKAFDDKFLEKVEKTTAKTVKKSMEDITKKMKTEYKADLAGFGNELRIKHPRLWEKLKKNWDETFTDIPITFHVQIAIKEYGTVGDQ
ncbi:Ger(x)C family spore germination protein [Bacillus licheniformis]|uniref:Ger(x)C family spore germination protein n=1 Tax=Bacillus licheniformis TaxID=1402 RepID=UPI0009495097|nr:Ger(x)C family spore germination protein [Bacillus licheniformis]ARC59050.1 spore germination protein B3 precursor [Bacillus licheniformis]MED0689732.1 Ger(x)C family spore germination protein [Bacillus licheniformis]MED0710438.1 Ger(x)C family spore germination protein [Bacillus licheniformis]MED0790380.1 Ger(x)C family spore germination protein [Bacillus licheniformis]OLF86421.1 putative spore germination protein YndF [Bacillus licheniformis]